MQNSNAIRAPQSIWRGPIPRQIRNTLLQKLWLPRVVYETLPYLYLFLGLVALTSAMYVPEWTWILPYAILLGLICLHFGIAILTLRYRFRYRRYPPDSERPNIRNKYPD